MFRDYEPGSNSPEPSVNLTWVFHKNQWELTFPQTGSTSDWRLRKDSADHFIKGLRWDLNDLETPHRTKE